MKKKSRADRVRLRVGRREVVYENRYQHIYRVKAWFDGFEKEYFVNAYGRRVGVVIIRGDQILLVRQYRFLVDEMSWRFPAARWMHTSRLPQVQFAKLGRRRA